MSYDLIDDAIWERLAPCFRRNGVAAGTGTVARKRRSRPCHLAGIRFVACLRPKTARAWM